MAKGLSSKRRFLNLSRWLIFPIDLMVHNLVIQKKNACLLAILSAGATLCNKMKCFASKLCDILCWMSFFFISVLHFNAYVTMLYRLVRIVVKLL